MSFLGKKQSDAEAGGLGAQAKNVARHAVPAAKNAGTTAAQQAVPLGKSAGSSVKHGASSAKTWATPYVGAARRWAAPKLEQSASTLTDSVAPRVSDALRTAAHKIDYVAPKPRRLKKAAVVTGTMLATAAGAVAAVTMRRRQGNGSATAPGEADGEPGVHSLGSLNDGHRPEDSAVPDPDADGHPTAS